MYYSYGKLKIEKNIQSRKNRPTNIISEGLPNSKLNLKELNKFIDFELICFGALACSRYSDTIAPSVKQNTIEF